MYQKSLQVLSELFGRDYTFVLATSADNVPSTRVVDTYYENGVFWVVTYAKSKKVQELGENPNVALCSNFHSFQGKAYNMGHPLKEENAEIRSTLINVFEPWYFAHNNEGDENMYYVKIEPTAGFFHKDGTGHRVSFADEKAETFPFAPETQMII